MPTFFIDRCLEAKTIRDVLGDSGLDVVYLSDYYGKKLGSTVTDVEWMNLCGQKGWVVLTKDSRIMRNAVEFDAVVRNRLVYFTFSNANMTMAKLAGILTSQLEAIQRRSKDPGPKIFVIQADRIENRTGVIGTDRDPRARNH